MNTVDPGKKSASAGTVVPWLLKHPRFVIGFLLLAGAGQCIDKAIYTDDALFVWAGQWIQQHPADFYGSSVNWWISDVPMWVANWNPPLLPYVFAAVGEVFGWHELGLHLVCLGFAFVAGAGIYSLAQMWCGRPLLAASMAICTPAFLVSSSTLMCDVPMLAFWVWAVVLWERAVMGGHPRWLFVIAGILAGLAVLTKYSALTLLPILPLLSVLRSRKLGWWLLGVAVVVVMVGGYEWLTARMYGQGLLAAASYHARSFRPGNGSGWQAAAIIGLCFTGGSFLPALFFIPVLWRPKVLGAVALLVAGCGLALYWDWNHLRLCEDAVHLKHWGFVCEIVLLAAGGVQLLVLAALEAWQRRNAISVILLLWIGGVMFFAVVVNWLINARSFLPLVPAAAILLARRLESACEAGSARSLAPLIPLGLVFIVSAALVSSDCEVANTEKIAAQQIVAKYQPTGHQLWFTGHGTFQYYLQNYGGLPIDATCSLLQPGDVVAVASLVPMTSYGVQTFPFGSVGWLDHLAFYPSTWINLAGETAFGAAGFYGANLGPVPFVPGGVPHHSYVLVNVLSAFQMDSKPTNLHGSKIDDVPNIPQILFKTLDQPTFPLQPAAAAEMQLAGQSESTGHTAEAIHHCRAALAVDNGNPQVLNQLAWLLATARDHQLRNGGEAARLAAQAVQITSSRIPAIMETLGAAYAEAGQFSGAIETTYAALSLAHLTCQPEVERQSYSLILLYSAGQTPAGVVQ